jgi:galactonate dehydratase
MYETAIKNVNLYVVKNPWKKWVFVEIETSDGSTGIGEATLYTGQFSVKERFKDVKNFIIGKDAMKIQALKTAWMTETFNRSRDLTNIALLSGIETACWDLVGKHFGAPVYSLLGGQIRDKIRVYANGWYTSIESLEDWGKAAKNVVKRGYTALKFDPFGPGSGFLSEEEFRNSMNIIEDVRNATGDKVELFIEGHGRFNRSTALRIGRYIEKFENIGWFEEPVIPEDIDGMSILAHSLNVPIAAGERFITKFDFVRPFEIGAIHVAQPDVINTGGILETREIASMAEAHNIAMAPHQAEGPINTFITLQLDAMIPNLKIQEMFDEFAYPLWAWEIVDRKPSVENGYVTISDRPGIGLNITEKVKNHIADENDRDFDLFSEGWEKRGFR